jgi:5'-methylthioinosine phosphorylase
MPAVIGVIGGSAFSEIKNLDLCNRVEVETPYGKPSSPFVEGSINGHDILFLHRHGLNHSIAPHDINYRANLWALRERGVKHVIATAAVGGITEHMSPMTLMTPDQVIDYTYGREHTYNHPDRGSVDHVDFTWPYDGDLRTLFSKAAVNLGMPFISRGTYGAVQGPRLESSAEIRRMEQDGCDIVGMTGMPEAGLARELGLSYATIAVVVNWAAGKGNQASISHDEMNSNIKIGMINIHKLLAETLKMLLES